MDTRATRAGMRLATLFACLLFGATVADARIARAQTVRGVVTRVGVPVAGVVVQLLDSAEAVAASSISDERGVYRVVATREGTYHLLARRVGFAPTRTEAFVLRAGITRDEPIALASLAIALDTIRVRASTCTVLSRANADVSAVWEQTKTALLATDATTTTRPLSTMLMRYEQLDRAGTTTVRSVSVQDADSAGPPWYAPSPRTMRDKGYAHWLTPTTMQFWAPSLEVLGSNEFAEDHCARLDDASDDASLVLAFEPRRKRLDYIDVAGRIVVDRRTAELRELRFHYTNVDSAAVQADAGGQMQFAKLRDGSWIVSDWFIRVPVVDTAPKTTAATRVPTRTVAYAEIVGGRVYVARRDDDTVFALPFPKLAGVIRDSLSGRAIPDAQLFLREAGRVAVTDSVGRFTLGAVRPGIHTLQVNTPSLDSLGSASVKRLLVVDSLAAQQVFVPSLRQALSGLCDKRASLSSTGVLTVIHGVVLRTVTSDSSSLDTTPAFVRAVWLDPQTRSPVRYTASADADGQYRLCGLPPDVPIDLVAERGSKSSVPIRAQLRGASPYGVKQFDVESRGATEGSVRGVVVDNLQRTVSGALVSIDSLAMRAITDMTGEYRFPRALAGQYHVTVQRLGFAPVDTVITVPANTDATITLRVAALARLAPPLPTADDSGAAAVQRAAFDTRRRGAGEYISRDRFERAEDKPLPELLRALPGTYITTFGLRGAVMRSKATTFSCPSTIVLDERPIYAGVGDPPDLSLFSAAQIEAVEWYDSEKKVPREFRGLAQCGLLVLHARKD